MTPVKKFSYDKDAPKDESAPIQEAPSVIKECAEAMNKLFEKHKCRLSVGYQISPKGVMPYTLIIPKNSKRGDNFTEEQMELIRLARTEFQEMMASFNCGLIPKIDVSQEGIIEQILIVEKKKKEHPEQTVHNIKAEEEELV